MKNNNYFAPSLNENLHFQKELNRKMNNAFGGDQEQDEVLKFKNGGNITCSDSKKHMPLKKGGNALKKK